MFRGHSSDGRALGMQEVDDSISSGSTISVGGDSSARSGEWESPRAFTRSGWYYGPFGGQPPHSWSPQTQPGWPDCSLLLSSSGQGRMVLSHEIVSSNLTRSATSKLLHGGRGHAWLRGKGNRKRDPDSGATNRSIRRARHP